MRQFGTWGSICCNSTNRVFVALDLSTGSTVVLIWFMSLPEIQAVQHQRVPNSQTSWTRQIDMFIFTGSIVLPISSNFLHLDQENISRSALLDPKCVGKSFANQSFSASQLLCPSVLRNDNLHNFVLGVLKLHSAQ